MSKSSKELAVYTNAYDQQQKGKLRAVVDSDKTYPQVLEYVENEIKKSKEMTSFNYTIRCFLHDGAYQLNRAVEKVYGVSITKVKDGPSEDKNFKTLDIKLSDGSRIKVPFDEISLPELGKDAKIATSYDNDKQIMKVYGTCQTKFQGMMDEIIKTTETYLETDSIYKNQAVEIDEQMQPRFINLAGIDREELILSDVAEYELISLRTRISSPEKCLANGIPLKFGTLLAGPYGTGKTLLAFKLAKEAINNKWMFIYLKNSILTGKVLDICKYLHKNGHGVVLFVEDIDQVVRGERNNVVQEILNTLDGGDTKHMNVISIFTTNHIELIEPTFLRGKRIGSIIQLSYIDKSMAKAFIDKFLQTSPEYTLDEDIDHPLDEVYQLIADNGIAPAFMTEIIEKIKAIAVYTDNKSLTSKDLKLAVQSYLNQVNLSRVKDTSSTPEKRLYDAMRETVGSPEDVAQKAAEKVVELM
jgi:ATP-dependent 26S proteasome regulatory subunit